MKKLLGIIIFLSLSFFLRAQIDSVGLPAVTNYTPLEYNAHFQNWEAEQDSNGIVYFANVDGIMAFDGKNWTVTELPDKLTVRCLTITKKGQFFVGGQNSFGYLSIDSNFNLSFIPLTKLLPDSLPSTVYELKSFGDTIYGLTSKYIFIYFNNTLKTYNTTKPVNKFFISSKNKLYAYALSYWATIKADSLEYHNSKKTIYGIFERNDTICSLLGATQIYEIDKNNNQILKDTFDFTFGGVLISNVQLYKNKYLIYTTNKGIFVLDKKGNLYTYLNKNLGLVSNNIYSVNIDNKDNLWLCTSNGLSYVELSSPFRYIDERIIPEITIPTFSAIFNNKIYLNAGTQVYSIKWGNIRHIDLQKISPIYGQTWNSLIANNSLLLTHNTQIFSINNKDTITRFGEDKNFWQIAKIPNYDNKYIVGGSLGLYVCRYEADTLVFEKKIKDFDISSREITFDSLDYLWVGNSSYGLFKIRLSDSLEIKEITNYNKTKGLTDYNSIMLFSWNNKLLISVYKTLFEYDYLNDTVVPFHSITDKFKISDKLVLQLVSIDNDNNFWFEYHNNLQKTEVFAFKYENGNFTPNLNISRRLLNYSVSFATNYNKNYLIFGSGKGFAILNTQISQEPNHFSTFIRKITLIKNDSIIYGGYSLSQDSSILTGEPPNDKLIIPFKTNSIRIFYASPFFTASNEILYRYKLINYDKEWSAWTLETKKDYTSLPPGKYIFSVEAKNIFNEISTPANFTIYIKYPWYRTIYAYIFYVIILIFILIGIVKFFTYSLKRKNEKLEEIVNERTLQIQQKNSELEQQTEEILTQAEELQMVNDELEKLSTIVRETDNAVILTDKDGNFIWVNNGFTKIFGFTLEELVSNVSKNIISDQTDPEIKKIINKCLTEKTTVEYELQLPNKFGKKTWIHTTLTPILDDENNITSLIAIDSDVTAMKLYEHQIREQSEEITASIKYARTIQESVLPAIEEIDAIFDNFIIYKPKDIVSGDFYWISNIFKTIEERLTHVQEKEPSLKIGYTTFFTVVDCTGHGVPGAFMSLISSHLLGEIINEQRYDSPKIILEQLDIKLSKALKRSATRNYDGMVVSLCRLDKEIKDNKVCTKITFTGAKQHISYYKKSTKELVKIRGVARQIGFVINENIKFEEHVFYLEKGDSLFMYSDGLKDLNNPQRVSFGHSQIRRILLANIDKTIKEIGEILSSKMLNWLGDDNQRDDITFLGLRIK